LPLIIRDRDCGLDNFVALLEHSDRVREINLMDISSLHYFEKFLAATQKPFPQLKDLTLWSPHPPYRPGVAAVKMPVVLDSFLGGSAPLLREVSLERIPFPGLPKLLLSATNLVGLRLHGIPYSGYISPEEMIATLSTLTNLGSLCLHFLSPRSRPYHRCPSPPTRSVLPVLTSLKFKGLSTYFEDLVAGIDAPRLGTLFIGFFDEIQAGTPKLVQFIGRTPKLKELKSACVTFECGATRVRLSSQTPDTPDYRTINVGIFRGESDLHISSLDKVLATSPPLLSTLEDLYMHDGTVSPPEWQFYLSPMPLEVLHPFSAAKNLYLSPEIITCMAPALRSLTGNRMTEVLPNLENIFLQEGDPSQPFQELEDIKQFFAARQVTGHPISIVPWQRSEEEFEDGDDFDPYDDCNEEDDW
jgi:hypothetical protein